MCNPPSTSQSSPAPDPPAHCAACILEAHGVSAFLPAISQGLCPSHKKPHAFFFLDRTPASMKTATVPPSSENPVPWYKTLSSLASRYILWLQSSWATRPGATTSQVTAQPTSTTQHAAHIFCPICEPCEVIAANSSSSPLALRQLHICTRCLADLKFH